MNTKVNRLGNKEEAKACSMELIQNRFGCSNAIALKRGAKKLGSYINIVTSLQKDQFHHKGTKFTKNSLEEHKEKLCTLWDFVIFAVDSIVQSDMNVALRKRNAIFISPFPAHFQQMNQKLLVTIGTETSEILQKIAGLHLTKQPNYA